MELLFFSMIISLLWGLQPIICKILLNNIDVKFFFVVFNLALFIAISFYIAFNWNELKYSYSHSTNKQLFLIAIIAIISSFIPNLIYYNLLNYHSSHMVAALTSCGPIFTILISFLFLKTNIDYIDISSVLLIVSGIFILSYNNN